MRYLRPLIAALLIAIFAGPAVAGSEDVYRLRMFFGLSVPGGGAVSLADWQAFEQREIARAFDGFNVVDSVGYYKGKPERSKVVTLIVRESEIARARALARLYAKRFGQESVMIVRVPVAEWSFVGPED